MPPPTKRPRATSDRGAPDVHVAAPPPPERLGQGTANTRWTRASAACHACRARKTRCDNALPACGYCTRASIECVYNEGPAPISLCQGVGPRLLEAVEHLTELIERNEGSRSPLLSQLRGGTPPSQPPWSGQLYGELQQPAATSVLTSAPKVDHPATSDTAGLESVLEWPIIPKPIPFLASPVSRASQAEHSGPRSPPSMELSEMTRLANKFLALAHPKNPIVDPRTLRQLIRRASENGPDWSSSTCLIALVCALGALSRRHNPGAVNGTNLDGYDEAEPDLAQKYWSVAEKRLGFAMAPANNPWEGVQCVCLAGIWHMYHMEPLQAWKCFSFAGHCWYTAYLEKRYDAQALPADGSTTEQSLYFTCYKSECELAFELPLPISVLASVNYPHVFPSPPDLDQDSADTESFVSKQKSWYYYLAEIASRHLINHILQSQKRLPLGATEQAIESMFKHVEVFESQLEGWYSSLPECITFDIPTADIYPLPDELVHHLRGRFMAIKELLCRPFVRLCTTYHLGVSEPVLSRAAKIASQGLQFCLLRIQATTSTQHHGLWFHVRTYVTCSVILLAAERAMRDPHYNGLSSAALPPGWRESILAKKSMLSEVWSCESGGIAASGRILDWALAGFQDYGVA